MAEIAGNIKEIYESEYILIMNRSVFKNRNPVLNLNTFFRDSIIDCVRGWVGGWVVLGLSTDRLTFISLLLLLLPPLRFMGVYTEPSESSSWRGVFCSISSVLVAMGGVGLFGGTPRTTVTVCLRIFPREKDIRFESKRSKL